MTRPTYLYYTATTLDGFIADENDSLDWLLSQPLGEGSLLDYDTFYAEVGALVMGSTTYEWVLRHEGGSGEGGSAWPYDRPTFVFSHRDLQPVTEDVTILSGTPEEHRPALEAAAGDGAVWIVGGGDLVAQFARAGLLDEVMVSIAPVTLGAGRPLLGGRFDLELREYGRNEAFLEARYALVGERA
ncbi:dihydrofolate reductase family protein [Brachybacterium sacelli]|uniref:Dihydrofolate reductase n=2 Tax=Brachybacterium sacelli TaxID=173364 RepID=A0ABS4WYE8_9MICO|nr:dihydrofolate reductase family protein [Brachybacterium sacelli]MBP2381131.1 dihydrofolate reductase [Brachybacterium sacelli]